MWTNSDLLENLYSSPSVLEKIVTLKKPKLWDIKKNIDQDLKKITTHLTSQKNNEHLNVKNYFNKIYKML
jgi:hypothetical protein